MKNLQRILVCKIYTPNKQYISKDEICEWILNVWDVTDKLTHRYILMNLTILDCYHLMPRTSLFLLVSFCNHKSKHEWFFFYAWYVYFIIGKKFDSLHFFPDIKYTFSFLLFYYHLHSSNAFLLSKKSMFFIIVKFYWYAIFYITVKSSTSHHFKDQALKLYFSYIKISWFKHIITFTDSVLAPLKILSF